jgi:hypothetical protein
MVCERCDIFSDDADAMEYLLTGIAARLEMNRDNGHGITIAEAERLATLLGSTRGYNAPARDRIIKVLCGYAEAARAAERESNLRRLAAWRSAAS